MSIVKVQKITPAVEYQHYSLYYRNYSVLFFSEHYKVVFTVTITCQMALHVFQKPEARFQSN